MQNINIDTFGDKLYINFREDISSNTALAMTIQPKDGGEKIEVTPTLGTTKTTVGSVDYEANQFVEYPTTEGMFNDSGEGIYRMKATATLSSRTITTMFTLFRVMP